MHKEHGGIERRQHKRVKMDFIFISRKRKPAEVIVFIGHKEIETVMIDLSEGGIALLTDHDIDEGTELDMQFTFVNAQAHGSNRIKEIHVAGIICNCRQLQHNQNRIGIEFLRLSGRDKRLIKDFTNNE